MKNNADKGFSNFAVAFLLFGVAVSIAAVRIMFDGTPPAAGPDAPPGEFSAARAMEHVNRLAGETHPSGTAAHAAAGDYLVKTLSGMGYTVAEQRTVGVKTWFPNYHIAGTVRNIAVKVPGTSSRGAILVMSHYDSVDTGPGANDDAAAAAAMLETLRVLKNGPRMRNDLIFLFTDGEEEGLLGASAFFDSHPWLRLVKLVINLEARGSGGPSTLFETGPGGGRIVREYISRTPFPTGNSLTNAVYAFLPNDTDFTIAREKGFPGFNFAYIENVTAYHSMLDSVNNVDPRSLQHHGSHLLSLSGIFGNDSLDDLHDGELVYFPLIGNIIARYSGTAAAILAAAVLGFAAALIFFLAGKKFLSPIKIAAGFGVITLFLAAVPLAAYLLWKLVNLMHPTYADSMMGDIYNGGWYIAAFTAMTAALYTLAALIGAKRIGSVHLYAGALIWWGILLAATTIFLRGASWVFQWPLLFGIIHLFGFYRLRDAGGARIFLLLLILPVLSMMPYLVLSLYVGLTISFAPVAAFFTALTAVLLIPFWEEILRRFGKIVPAVFIMMMMIALAGGSLASGYDRDSPRPNSAVYALDADGREAFWLSCDATLDVWTSQFFPSDGSRKAMKRFFPFTDRCLVRPYAMLAGKAPMLDLQPPEIRLVSDTAGAERKLRLRIRSPRSAGAIVMFINLEGQKVGSMALDGIPLKDMSPGELKPGHKILFDQIDLRKWIIVKFYVPSGNGFELSLTVKGGVPLEMICSDVTTELPDLGKMGYRPREPWMMPSPDFMLRDGTIVARKFVF